MAKEKVPDDLFERLSGRKSTESIRKEHVETTESIRKKEDFEKYRDSKYDTFTMRLLPEDIERLREYFERRGITLSQGLRTIIKDFMERQGL